MTLKSFLQRDLQSGTRSLLQKKPSLPLLSRDYEIRSIIESQLYWGNNISLPCIKLMHHYNDLIIRIVVHSD